MRGYYYYKQLCRAGRPGMAVAGTMAMDSEIALIGFSRNGTKYPDAFILINIGKEGTKKINVKVAGTPGKTFEACRTTDKQEQYKFIGEFTLENDVLVYEAPRLSATTFFAK